MTEAFIFVVFTTVFLALYSIIEFLFRILNRKCKPFRRMMRRIFESCPMWWN